MDKHAVVRQLLLDIERQLRATGLWQETPPEARAFASSEPFCIDTMAAEQWLQWVLLPRMNALLDARAPLPASFAIFPYFELAFAEQREALSPLLTALQALDELFARADT